MMAVSLPNLTNEHLFDSDECKLLGIFPLVVWQMILNQLEEPQDLTNCSNASPFFRKLLLPKRTVFLFPKVLEIMLANDGLDSNDPVGISQAQNSFDSVEESWKEIKSHWEYIGEDAESCVYYGDEDMKHGWELMCEGWPDIELAWNDLSDTFDNIQQDSQMAAFGWNRKVELWEDGIVKGWGGMRDAWETGGCRDSVNIVRNNWIKIKNISICTNDWIGALPKMRRVCVGWSKEIQQIMNSYNW